LAHAEVDRPWLLQVADVAGASGVSFVVAMVNVLAAMLLERPRAGRSRLGAPVALAGATLLAVVAYGRTELVRWRAPAGRPPRVAPVQGNNPDERRPDPPPLPPGLAPH